MLVAVVAEFATKPAVVKVDNLLFDIAADTLISAFTICDADRTPDDAFKIPEKLVSVKPAKLGLFVVLSD